MVCSHYCELCLSIDKLIAFLVLVREVRQTVLLQTTRTFELDLPLLIWNEVTIWCFNFKWHYFVAMQTISVIGLNCILLLCYRDANDVFMLQGYFEIPQFSGLYFFRNSSICFLMKYFFVYVCIDSRFWSSSPLRFDY